VPEATLHVLGDGPLATLLPQAGAGVVHVRPDPSRRAHQVRDLLRDASVVTTPSRTAADGDAESLLLVNLEAQASGRPVVTTRHGGIPEYVDDGTSALLVPEGDADALAAALIRVLEDDALATRLGQHGRVVATRYDVAACTAAVDDLYDELVATRDRR
jgi:colanic acid/amylovoran biosynthesis glycosyltransferase